MVPEFLRDVRCQPNLKLLHKEALDASRLGGLYCEFGVCHGTSLRMLRELIPRHRVIYGFDSFHGLPEPWNGHAAGELSTGGVMPSINNGIMVKGWFKDTIPKFAMERKADTMSYMHMDADLYSSTKTVLVGLNELIKPKTVILFDNLFGYDGWEQHEWRALNEWKAECQRSTEYLVRDDHQRLAVIVC